MQTNCILITFNFVIHSQILIFSVFCDSFPVLVADKIFHATVPLLNYLCDQFVELEIHHSRHYCSVVNNQHGIQRQGQDFDKKFVFEGVHSKQLAGEFQKWVISYNAICLHFLPCLLNICRKCEFLISQGSVATYRR